MGMTSMNVSLPEELKEFPEALDAMLIEGLRSGDSIPVDAKFWNELKREAMTKLAARKKSAKK
jgi:hypothetical protein